MSVCKPNMTNSWDSINTEEISCFFMNKDPIVSGDTQLDPLLCTHPRWYHSGFKVFSLPLFQAPSKSKPPNGLAE